MAGEGDHDVRLTTLTLPLRSKPVDVDGNEDALTPVIHTAVPPSLVSPGIQVELYGDPVERPGLIHPRSAPPNVQSFPSPMRHHRRTPSAHREIKETLNARSEYKDEDSDGRSHHHLNQYVIKDEIGRGSYGAVHLATDQFGNEYAVKAFSKSRLRKRAQSNILRNGPRQLGRFHRAEFGAPDAPILGFKAQQAKEAKDALFLIREEIAIMKKLNHPNLVQLMEVLDDSEDDSFYMVMEMCKKGVVMKVGLGEAATPYEEEQCRHWFRDLILGIEYLHSQGVVHRDIKPENLLLTDDDVLKIVDFGVSEMFEKSENMRTAKSAGSPAFLPPELCVARHGDVSGRAADIWSMGVSLYCLRYGRLPFERDGVLDIYEAIKTETAKLPPDENPDFVDLMGRVLEKVPENRITMSELREHPWVTRGATDPLLSAEENCSDPVDPPNPLELNHAFTRRMSHLICVMKAIQKFKSLLSPRPPTRHKGAHGDHETTVTPPSPSPVNEKPPAELPPTTAEFAARVLRERQEFLAKGGKASFDLPLHPTHPTNTTNSYTTTTVTEPTATQPNDDHHQPQQEEEGLQEQPPLLGIGTGGIDAFPRAADDDDDEPPQPADVVSDSPTVVDFNVYDRAFEAEIERIRRSTSRRGVGSGAGAGAGAGAGPRGRGVVGGVSTGGSMGGGGGGAGAAGVGGVSGVGGGGGGGGGGAAAAAAGGAGLGMGSGVIYQTRFSEHGGVGGHEGTPRSFVGAAGREQPGGGGARLAELVAQAMAAEEARDGVEGQWQ